MFGHGSLRRKEKEVGGGAGGDRFAANGSTSRWIGCARPIQGSGRMHRTQSAKAGMKPRSSAHVLLADQAHRHDASGRDGQGRSEETFQHEYALGVMAQCAVAKIRDEHLELVDYVDSTCSCLRTEAEAVIPSAREHGMITIRRDGLLRDGTGVELIDDAGHSVPIVREFLVYLGARGCSPNTALAYAHDLAHFWRFLARGDLTWDRLTPQRAVDLFLHLRSIPSQRRGRVSGPALATIDGVAAAAARLSPATVNRALAECHRSTTGRSYAGGSAAPIRSRV